MKIIINLRGKLVENRMLLIMERSIDTHLWEIIKLTYFYEGQTSVPLWPNQQCAWADEWNSNE